MYLVRKYFTQVSGRTALHTEEQKFDLMYEQLNDLKHGKSVMKPIYNHVNGTLDTPEEIKATPIVIIEGLHPFVDERVRNLLDFTIYLDISDEIKFAWKIQRDMMERGHSLESIKASIEVRFIFLFHVLLDKWIRGGRGGGVVPGQEILQAHVLLFSPSPL